MVGPCWRCVFCGSGGGYGGWTSVFQLLCELVTVNLARSHSSWWAEDAGTPRDTCHPRESISSNRLAPECRFSAVCSTVSG